MKKVYRIEVVCQNRRQGIYHGMQDCHRNILDKYDLLVGEKSMRQCPNPLNDAKLCESYKNMHDYYRVPYHGFLFNINARFAFVSIKHMADWFDKEALLELFTKTDAAVFEYTIDDTHYPIIYGDTQCVFNRHSSIFMSEVTQNVINQLNK